MADVTVGTFLGPIMSWAGTIVTSALYIAIIIGAAFGVLYILKYRKFQYPAMILLDLGQGKMGIEKCKAGWFMSNTILMGLIERGGNRQLIVTDGRKIENASSKDFQEIDGKRGIVLIRKHDDPAILVPIKNMRVLNEELLNEIAPADYRDASVKIVNRSQDELKGGFSKILTLAAPFVYALMLFICIMIIVQFGNHQIETILQISKDSCVQAAAALPPTTGAP